MEDTENILKPNKGLIPSLLRVFAIFQMRLFDYKYEVEIINISCKKSMGLFFKEFIIRRNDH